MTTSRLGLCLLLGLCAFGWSRLDRAHEIDDVAFYSIASSSAITSFTIPDSDPNKRTILVVTNADSSSPLSLRVSELPSPKVNSTPTRLRLLAPSTVVATQRIESTKPDAKPTPSEQRQFHVHTGQGPFDDQRFYHTVTAGLLHFDEQLSVYAHPGAVQLSDFQLESLAAKFSQARESVSQLLSAAARDIDGDGRFCVLLVPSGYQAEQPKAYVRPADFSASISDQRSNQADMLYLTTPLPLDSEIESLIAHELTHAVRCSLRPDLAESDWVHEGLAHCVEVAASESTRNINHRIARFLEHPERYPVIVYDYQRSGLFREHGCRGATFLFMDSVARLSGHDQFCAKVAQSGLTGVPNIESASDAKLAALFRNWTGGLAKQLHPEEPPTVRGGFVCVGPRTIGWDGPSLEIEVRPTATAFIDVSDRRTLAIQATSAVQTTLVQMSVRETLPITVEKTSRGLHAAVTCRANVTRLVVGVETTNGRRSESLAVHAVENPRSHESLTIELDDPYRQMTLKAFAQHADGTFSATRVELPGAERFASGIANAGQ